MQEPVYLILPNNKDESLSAKLLTCPDLKKSAFCSSCRSLIDPTLLQWITTAEPCSTSGFMFSSCPLAFALQDELASLLGEHLTAFYWLGMRTMHDAYLPGWLGLVPRADTVVIPLQSDGRDERAVCDTCGNEYWEGFGKDIMVRVPDVPPFEIFCCEAGMLVTESIKNTIERWSKTMGDNQLQFISVPVVESE